MNNIAPLFCHFIFHFQRTGSTLAKLWIYVGIYIYNCGYIYIYIYIYTSVSVTHYPMIYVLMNPLNTHLTTAVLIHIKTDCVGAGWSRKRYNVGEREALRRSSIQITQQPRLQATTQECTEKAQYVSLRQSRPTNTSSRQLQHVFDWVLQRASDIQIILSTKTVGIILCSSCHGSRG